MNRIRRQNGYIARRTKSILGFDRGVAAIAQLFMKCPKCKVKFPESRFHIRPSISITPFGNFAWVCMESRRRNLMLLSTASELPAALRCMKRWGAVPKSCIKMPRNLK